MSTKRLYLILFAAIIGCVLFASFMFNVSSCYLDSPNEFEQQAGEMEKGLAYGSLFIAFLILVFLVVVFLRSRSRYR